MLKIVLLGSVAWCATIGLALPRNSHYLAAGIGGRYGHRDIGSRSGGGGGAGGSGYQRSFQYRHGQRHPQRNPRRRYGALRPLSYAATAPVAPVVPPPPAPPIGGVPPHNEPLYPPQPYKFGFDTVDEYGTKMTRHEESDGHNRKKGSYSFTDANGITRRVDYVADEHGFRATVNTNEPGTANSQPASALINAPHSYHEQQQGPAAAGHGGAHAVKTAASHRAPIKTHRANGGWRHRASQVPASYHVAYGGHRSYRHY